MPRMRWRPGFRHSRAPVTEAPGPDWQRLSDGRPWRLQRGRDFDSTPRQFTEDVQQVAAGLGMAVRTVIEKTVPERFVWVQFAEAYLDLNRGCRCGGKTFRRLHPHFVRCESCGAQLLYASNRTVLDIDDDDEDEDIEPPEPTMAPLSGVDAVRERFRGRPQLDPFTDVHLDRYRSGTKNDRYAGYARDCDGELVFLVVTTPLIDGEPVPDLDSPIGMAHDVVAFPGTSFEGGLDISSLDDREWDIVLP